MNLLTRNLQIIRLAENGDHYSLHCSRRLNVHEPHCLLARNRQHQGHSEPYVDLKTILKVQEISRTSNLARYSCF